MPESDAYRLTPASGGPERARRPAPAGLLRGALWALLVLSATANMVVSGIGVAPGVNLACGLVTAACIVGLVLVRRRGHREPDPAPGPYGGPGQPRR
ncbi:hypothetical protein [Streptomyces albus]|uniref:hypothetical protein n=1 Tax=Streptomyces albus TaxID=1888 RepID=UPI0006E21266|nr:hypothetical protein [Streptomyces albus]